MMYEKDKVEKEDFKKIQNFAFIGIGMLIFCFLLNYSFVPYIPVVMGADHTCCYDPSILNPQLKNNICKILKKHGEAYIRLGDIILIRTYLLLDKEVGKLRRELSRISKRKSDLYEDYSERLITEEEYMQFSRIYSNEIENIKNRLDVVLAAQVRYSKDYHIEEGWGKVIHTYMSKRKLTKEMADAFVDSIIIHGKYDYEIKLVYDDQFADLQKLKKEKEAQSR